MDSRYQARINQAIEYIEHNIGQRLPLQAVAEASHFSAFHFHRIFKGIMDETLSDYVARRRLERAASMLACDADETITDVALRFGFSSSAHFSRAIKARFGCSPSDIRRSDKLEHDKIGTNFSQYGKTMDPADLYPARLTLESMDDAMDSDAVQVDVRDIESRRVCVLASREGYRPEAIAETWDQLTAWAVAQGIELAAQQRYAFCHDNPVVTAMARCRYEAAVVIVPGVRVESPFTKATIAAGRYAVMHFRGTPEDTLKAELRLFADWLPSSGFEPDNAPLMEHYLNEVREDGYREMEVFLKLKALA
ncbi:AraC family transcriptional regulator [Acidihalobacter yilgarnensis]|uniref:AraC family transcriptional regulator n=1 Tax=Acidihalobacter yilgarnensis TaxID=2819280 RepID=A0A1D8ISN5_9GAMM|nr:GyrI-like domain-containing protein [Acidihalobacter yilgarnensis]AOU99499.1 AraC family transcriptional regulator [Acidihalobacter yilgarnensis]